MKITNRVKRNRKAARKLPAALQAIASSKKPARSGKHRWRDNYGSRGAASEVRVIVKDGVAVGVT